VAEPVPVTVVSGEPVPKKAPVKTLVIPKPHPDEPVHTGKAGRPFWSGSITIGLVNVPVRLHTMVRDRSFSFRLLHREDGQPLRYDRVCTKDGRVIPWADTVKGYEVRKGEYVVFEPEELKAVMPESDRKIRIEKFVYYLSLDPIYFETPYILVPDRSEEAYSLLVTALQDIGRAAVGTITLRTKEYPVVVHVYGGGLVLTTLRHADEVTTPHAFEELTSLPAPKESELALAKRIIAELSGDFSITDYPDHYQEAVMSLIEKKLAGEKIVREEPHPEEAKELMQALQETIATLGKK
jgi:DNA end-binding protein Ku